MIFFLRDVSLFLSTLSLRRATPITFRHCTTYLFLSTLSLRRATRNFTQKRHPLTISIHALLTESDKIKKSNKRFKTHFYPRSPYGERRQWRRSVKLFRQFLSTLSLRRATIVILRKRDTPSQFLSTLSLRRATGKSPRRRVLSGPHFYPRSPYGERQSFRPSY